MTAKDLFQRDKELSLWWTVVVHDDKFSKAMLYAQNEFMQSAPDARQIDAVLKFTQIIMSISDSQETQFDLSKINPGLHHD